MVKAFISSTVGLIANETPDETIPWTQSTLSCNTNLRKRSVVSLALVSSSTMSSTFLPPMPPVLLIFSTANIAPRKPHSPIVPAIPARGANIPTLIGIFCAIAGKPQPPAASKEVAPIPLITDRRLSF